MINEWANIDLDLFREVLQKYLCHIGDSDNKVIEIQNLFDIYFEVSQPTRIFIGAKLDPYDWPDWNTKLINIIEDVGKDNFYKNCDLLFCSVSGQGPLLSPLPRSGKTFNIFWSTAFGDEESIAGAWKGKNAARLVLWYAKDKSGKIIYDITRAKTALSDTERFVRIRIMDYYECRNIINRIIKTTRIPEEFSKEDLKKSDFTPVKLWI